MGNPEKTSKDGAGKKVDSGVSLLEQNQEGDHEAGVSQTQKVDPAVYTFKQEFKEGGNLVKEVTPRRLTGRDIIDMEAEIQAETPGLDYQRIGAGERILRQIAKSCGWLYEDVLDMDGQDVNGLGEKVTGFLY